MGTPWKKNLLKALDEEHRCKPPSMVQPPYGHQCAVCGRTVGKNHPLHRAERPGRSEVQLVSALPKEVGAYGLYTSQFRG